jgi:L-alanine-DL-glutamate epimerase-like enolase superfamily enzyme
MKITRLRAVECKLSLPRPIRLGPVEIHTRDFVALRLETADGAIGDALGYPRGTALLEAVRRLAPHVLGHDAHLRRGIVSGMLDAYVNGRPTFVKAASLFDIALWDLASRAASLPLTRMLGGARDHVPVMVVAGYYPDMRTPDDICDEVRRRVDEGYSRIKIMIRGDAPDADTRLVEMAWAIAGDRLSVDAHWAWRSIAEAHRTCRRIDHLGLRFIEDPFGPHKAGLCGRLQEHLQTPLAVGEDLPSPQTISEALDHVTILRLDATTCGGVAPALAAAEAADTAGVAVLPHVFLPIHAQLAGSLTQIEAVELIPDDTGACPMFDLLEDRPNIDGGILTIDQHPGAGFRLDWDAVVRHAASGWALDWAG